jgi:hypothetical protein
MFTLKIIHSIHYGRSRQRELANEPLPGLDPARTCHKFYHEAALPALNLNTIHRDSSYALSWVPHYLNMKWAINIKHGMQQERQGNIGTFLTGPSVSTIQFCGTLAVV